MNIYIVEDSAIIRGRLLVLLSGIQNINITGMSGDADKALKEILTYKPEVVILDINLYGGNGIDILREVKDRSPETQVLILTNYPYPQYRERCLSLGADHFLDKSKDFGRIADLINRCVC